MIVKNYKDIYTDMCNYIIANQNIITDFNAGSFVATNNEAVAREIEDIYVATRVGYDNNLKAIPLNVFDFRKKSGTKATGRVVFKRDKANPTKAFIPLGTKISKGTYVYETTQIGEIKSNETESNEIGIQAVDIGDLYNTKINTIETIESYLANDISMVTNITEIRGGANEESETEFLKRFKDYINGLQGTNTYALKSALLSIDGIKSISIFEHEQLKNDYYHATVYVADGSGGISQSLMDSIKLVVYGDDTAVNPGHKAPGINIDIQPASLVNIDLKISVKTYRTANSVAIFDIEKALKEEINKLGIGEDVVLLSLVLKLRRISYIKDLEILAPENNIKIGNNQIATFNSVELEIENI